MSYVDEDDSTLDYFETMCIILHKIWLPSDVRVIQGLEG
jgi:hypothetical protein